MISEQETHMLRWLLSFALLGSLLIAQNAVRATVTVNQAASSLDHVTWVGQALERMEMIRPGMTRRDLVVVFTTEGGISSRLHRTFVSRECPYFKVDVEFEAVGPSVDANSRAIHEEDERDIIKRISRPYLRRRVTD
jgi:hypothetical protein